MKHTRSEARRDLLFAGLLARQAAELLEQGECHAEGAGWRLADALGLLAASLKVLKPECSCRGIQTETGFGNKLHATGKGRPAGSVLVMQNGILIGGERDAPK